MLVRIRRKKLLNLFLDVVFVSWVLYVTATGRLLPEELSFKDGGGHHTPTITQPVQAPTDDPSAPPLVISGIGAS